MEEVDSTGKVLNTSMEKLEDMGLVNIEEGGKPVLSKKGEQLMLGDEILKKAWGDNDADVFLKRTLELMD